jgi:hypothetical protein
MKPVNKPSGIFEGLLLDISDFLRMIIKAALTIQLAITTNINKYLGPQYISNVLVTKGGPFGNHHGNSYRLQILFWIR